MKERNNMNKGQSKQNEKEEEQAVSLIANVQVKNFKKDKS